MGFEMGMLEAWMDRGITDGIAWRGSLGAEILYDGYRS